MLNGRMPIVYPHGNRVGLRSAVPHIRAPRLLFCEVILACVYSNNHTSNARKDSTFLTVVLRQHVSHRRPPSNNLCLSSLICSSLIVNRSRSWYT